MVRENSNGHLVASTEEATSMTLNVATARCTGPMVAYTGASGTRESKMA